MRWDRQTCILHPDKLCPTVLIEQSDFPLVVFLGVPKPNLLGTVTRQTTSLLSISACLEMNQLSVSVNTSTALLPTPKPPSREIEMTNLRADACSSGYLAG